MKKSFKISLLLMFVTLTGMEAQECNLYFPTQVGTVREMKHYDRKDRLTGVTRQEVMDYKESGNKLELVIQAEMKDDKGKEITSNELTLYCEDGIFYMDMSEFIPEQSKAALESMEFTIEQENLQYPGRLAVGDELDDGVVTMTVEQMPMLNTTVTIYNRKVTDKESITTEAGTFDCFKITYDIESKSMMTFNMSSVEWINPEVGVVKSESYNKRGKLTGYTLLTAVE